MGSKFSDFLKIKPGDILWLVPKTSISSNSCRTIDKQEFGVLVKVVYFSPSRKDADFIRLKFDEIKLKSSEDNDDFFADSITIQEEEGIFSSASLIRIESYNKRTCYGNIGFSSVVIDKR